MSNKLHKIGLLSLVAFVFLVQACTKDENIVPNIDDDANHVVIDTMIVDTNTVEVTIENLLANQVNGLIIPTYENYKSQTVSLVSAVESFITNSNSSTLATARTAYLEAYIAYQASAVHNYYATANLDLVNTTNLYPIDLGVLAELIENESYNFNVLAQHRANGFPAIDYLLYGLDDPVTTFSTESKTANFLLELVKSIDQKADLLIERWTGNLRENFIGNGGVELGSSISVQLNESLIYYEDHVRENKIGIPIGKAGPNDTPFDPDATKIEAYYQAQRDGDDHISLSLLRAAVEEMEDIYLGRAEDGSDGIGYEDLLLAREQESLDADIKDQYQAIYDAIDNRSFITGDASLYHSIQELVTLYKSDLFPVLNIQDADGANDGD